ncbi:hypothetical protein ACJX0J_026543 [Zea mays]
MKIHSIIEDLEYIAAYHVLFGLANEHGTLFLLGFFLIETFRMAKTQRQAAKEGDHFNEKYAFYEALEGKKNVELLVYRAQPLGVCMVLIWGQYSCYNINAQMHYKSKVMYSWFSRYDMLKKSMKAVIMILYTTLV